jgi:hypothetical protein
LSLWPREHGAYGQITFPLVAALAVTGVSFGGLALTTATVAGFLAHEPALVLLGFRGPRARRELWNQAVLRLGCYALIVAAAGIAAMLGMHAAARWWIAVPLVPAALLVVATLRGAEKTWYGETAAALAFSGVAVPVSIAGGLSPSTALTVAIPFALLFVSTTLAVRVVILRVRGGGNVEAAAATRRTALALAVGSLVFLTFAAGADVVPRSTIGAAAPGLITAAAVALRPPAPSRLRTLGWTLVAISMLTTVIVVVTT